MRKGHPPTIASVVDDQIDTSKLPQCPLQCRVYRFLIVHIHAEFETLPLGQIIEMVEAVDVSGCSGDLVPETQEGSTEGSPNS